MDKKNLNELKPLLDIMQQPAFVMCDSALTYQNPAFRELNIIAGTSADAFLSAIQSASLAGEAEQLLSVTGGKGYFITKLPLEDGTLYLLRRDSAYETANFLSRIVSVQRNSLNEVYAFGIKAIERSDATQDERASLENGAFFRGIHRLTRTLNNMDLFQQLINGRRKLHTENVFLRDYCEELLEKAEGLLRQNDLTLKTSLPKDNPMGWLDTALVEEALWNLLANAGANAPDKLISLRVSYADRLVMEVRNAGALPENRHIFEKKQIPIEEDFCVGGLGIGIPLLQEITRLHGGGLIPASTQDGTCLAASFATDIIGKPLIRSSKQTIQPSNDMDRGLIGLSGLLPKTSYLPEDILG